jgi:hypothetical protein
MKPQKPVVSALAVSRGVSLGSTMKGHGSVATERLVVLARFVAKRSFR